jgi:glucose-1-phosphate adenylyltransferase
MELTERRAKPAAFFGCNSRIIDFALSNALYSGIRHIGVATQYQAHSLIRHLQRGGSFLRTERNENFDRIILLFHEATDAPCRIGGQ